MFKCSKCGVWKETSRWLPRPEYIEWRKEHIDELRAKCDNWGNWGN